MTNYKTMSQRIRDAKSTAELKKLEQSLIRIYNAGQLSVNEFARLDVKIMESIARFESAISC